MHGKNLNRTACGKPHLLLLLNRKKRKKLHNTLQLNTMEENITVIKTTMGVLARDQVALQVNVIE